MALMFLFLYAPIIVLIVFSFNSEKTTAHWTGFTFDWYRQLFHDRQIMKALYYTVSIAVLASVISTIVGTFAAMGLYKMKRKPRKFWLTANNLPILNPDIVTGIAIMILFKSIKMEFGYLTLLLSHITFDIPFVIISVLPRLRQMPKSMVEAALDLGATPMYALRKIVLPEIKPGIITGFLIAFTMSIDDFVISFFTTGKGVTNLSIVIYSMAKRGINPKINALSALMFIVVLLLLLIISFRDTKVKRVNK